MTVELLVSLLALLGALTALGKLWVERRRLLLDLRAQHQKEMRALRGELRGAQAAADELRAALGEARSDLHTQNMALRDLKDTVSKLQRRVVGCEGLLSADMAPRLRVLVVENDDDVRGALSRWPDGQYKGLPNLAIVDRHLNGPTGDALLTRLAADGVPTLMITGDAEGAPQGAVVLPKPIAPIDLGHALVALILGAQ
jgi:hypothetical protein